MSGTSIIAKISMSLMRKFHVRDQTCFTCIPKKMLITDDEARGFLHFLRGLGHVSAFNKIFHRYCSINSKFHSPKFRKK